jgi:hypothetical protein
MKDFELSKNHTKDFQASQSYQNLPHKFDFNVAVFSVNAWPLKNSKIQQFDEEVSNFCYVNFEAPPHHRSFQTILQSKVQWSCSHMAI